MGGEGNCARLLAGERGGMASFACARAGADAMSVVVDDDRCTDGKGRYGYLSVTCHRWRHGATVGRHVGGRCDLTIVKAGTRQNRMK